MAAKFLKRLGYRVVDRNVRLGAGEADLICLDAERVSLIVVEVKTRRVDPDRRTSAPPAEANITATKRRMLIGLAHTVAARVGVPRGRVRIDVVAVDLPKRGRAPLDVRHYPSSVY